jgi:hypothetical protein
VEGKGIYEAVGKYFVSQKTKYSSSHDGMFIL